MEDDNQVGPFPTAFCDGILEAICEKLGASIYLGGAHKLYREQYMAKTSGVMGFDLGVGQQELKYTSLCQFSGGF